MTITSYKLQSLTSEQIRKMAIMEVSTIQDLRDDRLGATQITVCKTCNQSFQYCCGHLGYIQLKNPIIKPIMQTHLLNTLKTFCILHKRVENKPCQTIKPIYYDDTLNKNMIQYFSCAGNCLSGNLDATPVIITNRYIQVLLERVCNIKDVFIDVVPVISNALRQVNIQQNSNIFNNIYEKIIKLNNDDTPIEGTYLRQQPTKYQQQLDIACRIIMFKDTSKSPNLQVKNQMLKALDHSQNVNEAASPFAAFIAKKGWGRQICNSNRVNQSCRTVITGDPYLHSWQVVCPADIAKEIQIPVMVNNVNITKLKQLIKNFPNYPCITKVKPKNIPYFKIVRQDYTQQSIYEELQPGDIVYRQVLDNDICLVNRYPSIREESFGQHIVRIQDGQTIKFNLQVIKKMQADFDGDEMQLYFMASKDNNIELLLLSSMQRQLITYETGTNIIGGAKDLDAGIFNLNGHYKRIEKIIAAEIPHLNYIEDSINIQNGHIYSLSSKIADADSPFISYIAQIYGANKAIKITDNIICYLYKVNDRIGTTLYTNLFNHIDQPYTQMVIDKCIEINKRFYNQKVYNKTQHNIALLDCMQEYQMKQVELIPKTLNTPNRTYFNKLVSNFQEQLRAGCINLGQIYDDDKRIVKNERTLCCFPKFSIDPQAQGYIAGNYIDGLNAAEVFFESIMGRKQLYDKGNQVSRDGYTTRRLTKGTNNTIAGYNGLIFSDSDTVVSYQYGVGGSDPRSFKIVKVYAKDVVDKDFYAKHFGDKEFVEIQLPFKPQQTTITQKELDLIPTCRITENMTQAMQEIIYCQAWNFYLYCRLTMRIDNDNPTNIIQQYLESLVAAGELVGLKAAHASTQPYTQATLHSIHKGLTASVIKEVVKSAGAQRFMELVTNAKGTPTVMFKLMDGVDSQKFIQKYQSYVIADLDPKFKIDYVDSKYVLTMIFDIEVLGAYNVYIKNIDNYMPFKFISLDIEGKNVIFKYSGEFSKLLKFCENNQYIQTSCLQNITYNTRSGMIYANLVKSKQSIFDIREVDITSVVLDDVQTVEKLFGIQEAREVLYNELFNNLGTLKETKNVQSTHVQLITDILTQTGAYRTMTSTSYKKQDQKDIIQLALFEYTNSFLQNYLTKQYKYNTNTLLNSTLFGTKPKAGSTYSEIYCNDYLQQQDLQQIIAINQL